MIGKLVKKSGVNSNITTHSFRRSYATYQNRYGVPLEIIRKAMGHGNVKSTDIYIMHGNEEGEYIAN